MNQSDRSCKGCREEYKITEVQIDRMLSAPMFQGESCVPESVYQERLRMCGACPKLLGGTTCSFCGCIVRVAAKLKEKNCPFPGASRWK
ncbi:DUF6171 family protein [Paenibacillus sp. HWE-109]|uniref:DUF6171 family protein n=1 Tax=Paenibacillus sp. HWE-109 TaxID=1306526 RepID=UPI001EE0DC5D|nr:DUF6171 family protein [Paenibacillus sp. HWE-109]UKS30873.1 DUF6171 family protein [Paenibacillus sp. HWE-109]